MALPVMLILSTALWGWILFTDYMLWPCCLLFLLNTYLMVELNNRHALMRQYSRMVSCSYIMMMMMSPWLLKDVKVMGIQFCLLAALSLIFLTYQQRQAMGQKYWAYVFIGIAMLLWPPAVFLLPLFWIGDAFFLMAFSFRAFFASIFGILTPLWLCLPLIFYFFDISAIITQLQALAPGQALIDAIHNPILLLPHEMPVALVKIPQMTLVCLTISIGVAHYFRNNQDDKIQVRMVYQFLTLIGMTAMAFLIIAILLPLQKTPTVDILYAMLIVCNAPILGHFITFASSRISNTFVFLCIALALGITVLLQIPLTLLPVNDAVLHLLAY